MHKKCYTNAMLFSIFALALGTKLEAQAVQQLPSDRRVEIVAEEMCCEGCARKVSGELYAARGVKSVAVNMESHVVSISLSPQKSATLEQLWQAVEKGDGGPTKIVTADATYTLTRPEADQEPSEQKIGHSTVSIVIDNLHCKGCAQKIAAQLYTIKGVTKVSADLKRDTLFVESRPEAVLSPWQVIAAVSKAKERPLAVQGPHGTLAIQWAKKRIHQNHHHSHDSKIGGTSNES